MHTVAQGTRQAIPLQLFMSTNSETDTISLILTTISSSLSSQSIHLNVPLGQNNSEHPLCF